MIELDIRGSQIAISFPYSDETVRRVKHLTYDFRKADRYWLVSCSRLEEIYAIFPDAVPTTKMREWIELQRTLARIKDDSNGYTPFWVGCELLDHQKSALAYLVNFSHCANFDPPGSGKTRVAAGWAMKRGLPALVACPASVKYHWRREILLCNPGAKVGMLAGKPRFDLGDLGISTDCQWIICNWEILKSWVKYIAKFSVQPVSLIADEAQSAKAGDRSQCGTAILRLAEAAPNVHYMTGSPVLNRTQEIEPTLIALQKLTPRERFAWRVRFCDGKRICINEMGVKYHHKEPQYRWSFKGSTNTELLERELETFSVRRPDSVIQKSLPETTHTLLELDLPNMAPHNKLFREMRALKFSQDPVARGKALALIGQMLAWAGAEKAPQVAELLQARLDVGESAIVFSDFLAPLAALRPYFPDRSLLIDGSVPQAQRDALIAAIDRPTVVLAGRKAIGTGTDGLQHKMRLVYFVTLCWNSEAWAQAWKRVRRQGQTRPVEVITTLARGTAEEAVLRILYEKAKVTDILCSSPALSDEARGDWESVLSLLGGLS